jgi:hypothetical protein
MAPQNLAGFVLPGVIRQDLPGRPETRCDELSN